MAPPKTITTTEAAALLGVGWLRVKQLIRSGDLRAKKGDNGRWLVTEASAKRLKKKRDSGEVQAWRKRS